MIEYICVLDFEATCEKNDKKFMMEIIEFPSVLLKYNKTWNNYDKIDNFQMYCKPLINTTLTKFCTKLTGIYQGKVDNGCNFPKAFDEHYRWLIKNGVGKDGDNLLIVTWGPWDIKQGLIEESLRWEKLPPSCLYTKFIDLKDEFTKFYRHSCGMASALKYLKMDLVGRHHSGLDDCLNISRIFQKMHHSGYRIDTRFILTTRMEDYEIKMPLKRKHKKYRKLVNQRIKTKKNEY